MTSGGAALIHIITRSNRRMFSDVLTEMHRQRKQLFVDCMGWKLETCADLEIDAFDSDEAIYLIETDEKSGHVLQSARLMSSEGPHLLGEVFPHLCAEGPPRAPGLYEASRFCPAPETPKGQARRALLYRMIAAILETGLLFGIERVSFVASAALAPLARRAGWQVSPLGAGARVGRERLSAWVAVISTEGLARVRALNGLDGPLTRYADPAWLRAA
jgi:N-acyl-L-homoserine lactone synthetase